MALRVALLTLCAGSASAMQESIRKASLASYDPDSKHEGIPDFPDAGVEVVAGEKKDHEEGVKHRTMDKKHLKNGVEYAADADTLGGNADDLTKGVDQKKQDKNQFSDTVDYTSKQAVLDTHKDKYSTGVDLNPNPDSDGTNWGDQSKEYVLDESKHPFFNGTHWTNDVSAFSALTVEHIDNIQQELLNSDKEDRKCLEDLYKQMTGEVQWYIDEKEKIKARWKKEQDLLEQHDDARYHDAKTSQKAVCAVELELKREEYTHRVWMINNESSLQDLDVEIQTATKEDGICRHTTRKDLQDYLLGPAYDCGQCGSMITYKTEKWEHWDEVYRGWNKQYAILVKITKAWAVWPKQVTLAEETTDKAWDFANELKKKKEDMGCDRVRDTKTMLEEYDSKISAEQEAYDLTYAGIQRKVANRKKEWTGTHTVECLLNRIHNHAENNEPCDTDFYTQKQGLAEIDACKESKCETSFLDIPKQPVKPPMPLCAPPYCIREPTDAERIDLCMDYKQEDGSVTTCKKWLPCIECKSMCGPIVTENCEKLTSPCESASHGDDA